MFSEQKILTIAVILFCASLYESAEPDVSFPHLTGSLKDRKSIDFVLIIGRHQSIGRKAFYKTGRPIAISLLKYFAMVHKNYTRLAVITYADSATVDYDDISNNPQPKHKCQIFPTEKTTTSLFDNVNYDVTSENSSCGYEKAMSYASDIFNRGRSRRPGVTQIALAMTSGVFEKCEPSRVSTDLLYAMKDEVKFFAVGIGKSIDDNVIRKLVSPPDNRYYGNGDLWISNLQNSMQRFDQPLLMYEEMPTIDPCLLTSVGPPGARCYCDLNFGLTRWMCPEGYFELSSASGISSCKACPENTYKSVIGSSSCTSCQSGQNTKNTGLTSWQDCFSSSTPFSNPCVNGKCAPDQLCIPQFNGNILKGSDCFMCGIHSSTVTPGCPTRMCYSSPLCQNSGKCVDLVNDFACVCSGLYYGRNCQFKENNCRFPLMCGTNRCVNESTGINFADGFKCECSEYNAANNIDEFCDISPSTPSPATAASVDLVPSSTTTSTKFPRSPEVVVVSDAPASQTSSDNKVIIGVVTAVAFLSLVATVTGILVYIRLKKKRAKSTPLNLYDNFNNEPFMGATLTQRLFSRPWKAGDCDTIKEGKMLNGIPSVPADVDGCNSVRRESSINSKEPTMDDWKKYFDKLVTSGVISKGLIIDLHKKEFACSVEWDVNWSEVYSLDMVLGDETAVNVQGTEYLLNRPKNRTIVGRSVQSDNVNISSILVIGRTRNYLIVGICESDDVEEIFRKLAQHIYAEGY